MISKSKDCVTLRSPVRGWILNEATTFAGDCCLREYTTAPLELRSPSMAIKRLIIVPIGVS